MRGGKSPLLSISSCLRQSPALLSIYIAESALAAKWSGSGSLSVMETMRRDSTAAKTCPRLSDLQDFRGVFAALTVMGSQFPHTKPFENGVSVPGPELPNIFCCIKIKGR